MGMYMSVFIKLYALNMLLILWQLYLNKAIMKKKKSFLN